MAASWPQHRIKALGGSDFRLLAGPIDFAGFAQIDIFVDVETTVSTDGRVELKSKSIEVSLLKGDKCRKVPVEFDLQGVMEPVVNDESQQSQDVRIKGFVQYESAGTLQGGLLYVPTLALRLSTKSINKTILTFAKRDFVSGIKNNFREWYTPERQSACEETRQLQSAL